MSPSLAEIVCAVGAGSQLVGVDNYTEYPPEAAAKPKLGGIVNPNLESILAVQPDLVLAAYGVDMAALKRLQTVSGLATLSYDPQSVEQVLDTITQIGQVCGREAAAQRLVAQLRARQQAVADRVAARSGPRPRVMLVIAWDGLFIAGPQSFSGDLLEKAGADNVARTMKNIRAEQAYPNVTREMVVLADPQVLLFAGKMSFAGTHSLPGGTTAEGIIHWLQADPAWRNLSAVKSGSVFIMDENQVNLPSPRLWDGLEAVSALLGKLPADQPKQG
jgi:iron complex transport system substrate-binding protein